MRNLLLGLVLAVAPILPLGAQQVSTTQVRPGARVRVRTDAPPPGRTVIGTVMTFDGDTLSLAPAAGGAEQRIPVATVRQLEVSRGRGVVGSHILLGGVAGAVAGGLIAGAANSCSPQQWFCFQGLAIMGGVVLGGAVGAGVGALIKGERWRNVPLSNVALYPVGPRGVGVSIGMRF